MNELLQNRVLLFLLVLFIIAIWYPFAGWRELRKLGVAGDKVRRYRGIALGSWLPVLPVGLALAFGQMSPAALGFLWPRCAVGPLGFAHWPVLILFVLHLLYNFYSLGVLKWSPESRKRAASGLAGEYREFLPVSRREKRAWVLVAVSAGITEEIVYRGYLFFILAALFPVLSPVAVFLISGLLFALGHIYQKTEVIKPLILGLLFGLYYLACGSLLPVITIHILQDLIVIFLFDEN